MVGNIILGCFNQCIVFGIFLFVIFKWLLCLNHYFIKMHKVKNFHRGFITFLCRRSVGVFSRAFLVFLMKESKKRR